MTNMPVLDKNSVAQNLLSAKGTKPVASSGGGNFEAVLRQTQTTAKPESKTEPAKVSAAKEPTEDVSQKEKADGNGRAEETAKGRDAETKTEVSETEDVSEDITEDTDALVRAGGEMAAMLAAQMGISAEELAEAMDELGMTEISLLDPKNVKDLMVHLTEGADDMSVLTDEAFYNAVNEALESLEEVVANLKDETGMSDGEFKEALQTALEQPEKTVEVTKEAAVQDAPETKEAAKPVTFTAPKPELTESARTGTVMPKEMSGKENAGRDAENPFMGNDGQTAQLEANTEVQAAETESRFSAAQTQEIMDQIMDYMKFTLNADTTSLEMQLHPASLGTLQIQIASKGGVVTANFIAQNEAVKAALESQMVQLREQFEEQGVKVEAIEVTVQTHEFEQNLEQGRGRNHQETEKKGRGRRISLGGAFNLEDQEESLTEPDMMVTGSSTVSYTA